jgi:glycosyltransferase involved in cell wall biosynthesis
LIGLIYGYFIEEAIRSVLIQDFSAEQIEIIVMGDRSTDDARELGTKCGERVQSFEKLNGKQASASTCC